MASTCLSRVGISGLVVEYVVAIDVTRVRFPADALPQFFFLRPRLFWTAVQQCDGAWYGCLLTLNEAARGISPAGTRTRVFRVKT